LRRFRFGSGNTLHHAAIGSAKGNPAAASLEITGRCLMTHIYLLYHLHRLRSGAQQVLFLGAYGSRPSALRAIERLRKLPGFKVSPKLRNHKTDHRDGFNLNRTRLGQDNWPEGFGE
jgi:hypothetical protein